MLCNNHFPFQIILLCTNVNWLVHFFFHKRGFILVWGTECSICYKILAIFFKISYLRYKIQMHNMSWLLWSNENGNHGDKVMSGLWCISVLNTISRDVKLVMTPEILLAFLLLVCSCDGEFYTAEQCKSFSYSEFLAPEQLECLREGKKNKWDLKVRLLRCWEFSRIH